MTIWRAAVAGTVGTVLIVVASLAAGLPGADVAVLVGVAGGAALAVGLSGAAALSLLRGTTFATQVTVVALTATAAVAAGSLAAAQAMFLDYHDVGALWVVTAVAALVGVLTALVLSHRVAAASRSLGEATRRLADGEPPVPAAGRAGIGEFTRLEEELRSTAARLDEARAREQAADRSRRELVAWVSHDLRTPLAGIRAIAEALEDGVVTDDATVARYHTTLRRETDRLARLVDDLFELSRVEARSLVAARECVDLGDLVSDAVAAAGPVADARGVCLRGRVTRPATVAVAVADFGRVLGNLVGNAVRETPAGGEVCVESGVDGDAPYVAVRDGCGGISTDELERVFEAGFRASDGRTPSAHAGAGLGLAIARGIAAAHDATLGARNVPGGCEFRVTLPPPSAARHPTEDGVSER